MISDKMEIANIFNKHFIDQCVAAHIPILPEHALSNHLSVNKHSQKCNQLQFSFRHVQVGYVKKLIDTLNPKKTPGPSPTILTVSSEALAEHNN